MDLLQIVHFETNDGDAELVRAELQAGGIACEVLRVRNESELKREVARQPVDIILADRHGPHHDGLEALTIARAQSPEVPVIFVCDADDAGAVSEALQAGATDFILKGRLTKLVPSIRRLIQQTETQRDLERARQELLRHAELLDLANDAIVISDASDKITYWNRGAERMYGWSREDATGREARNAWWTCASCASPVP